jgi:retron-type reverse transcriptase
LALAEILELPGEELTALAGSARRRYRRILLPRPGRAPRAIDAPDEDLKEVQRRILRRMLVRVPVSRHAHGFVPGRSAVTAAREHAGRQWVVTFDLRDFFPSVKSAAVRAVAGELGLAGPDAGDFVRLTTLGGRLPQGAPTSPALANLAFRRADARLAGLAETLGLAYTRYADDLAFSGGAEALRIAASVKKIVAADGFRLAAEKTRRMPRSARQEVCGLVVNDGVRLPREARRLLRAIVHDAARRGLAAAGRGRGERFPEWLAGHLAWLAAVDCEAAEWLVSEIEHAR